MPRIKATTIDFYSNVALTGSSSPIFQNKTQQNAFWDAKRVGSISGALMVRGSSGEMTVRTSSIGIGAGDLTEISFINSSYENKTFFARVVDFTTVSNKATKISFAIDYFQTFMFDYEVQSCQVLREGMTASEHALATANPWRNDIHSLSSAESGLPIDPSQELLLKAPSNNVDSLGMVNRIGGVPLQGNGSTGRVVQWPEMDVTQYGINGRQNTVVIELAKFPMKGDPFGSQTGPFYFSDLTGEEPSVALGTETNVSWITPGSGNNAGTVLSAVPMATYLIGIRLDGGMHTNHNVANTLVAGSDGGSRLSRLLTLLARYDLTHMIVGGPSIVPNAMVEADIRMQGITTFPAGLKLGAKVITAPTATYNDYGHPKLQRGPFRYLRVEGPDGQTRPYNRNLFSSPSSPKFVFYADFDAEPTISAVPMQYNGQDVAADARLSFGGFPVMAFGTDASLTYMASMRQEALMGALRPSDELRVAGNGDDSYMQSQYVKDGFVGGLGAVGDAGTYLQGVTSSAAYTPLNENLSVASAVGGRHIGVSGMAAAGAVTSAKYNASKAQADNVALHEDSQILNWSKGVTDSDLPAGMSAAISGAMVGTNFKPGSVGNALMSKLSRQSFKIVDVQLDPTVVSAYADYLTMYGYSSGILGTPKVVNASRGGESMKFHTVNGRETTYVITSGMKVSGVPVPARAAIEGMFNGGHRFIKGW